MYNNELNSYPNFFGTMNKKRKRKIYIDVLNIYPMNLKISIIET